MERTEMLAKKAKTLLDLGGAVGPAWMDEAACREAILRELHPDGARCPRCGHALPEGKAGAFWEVRRMRCDACGAWFTALSGTPMDRMHIGFRCLAILALGVASGWSASEIARRIDRDPDTVRRYVRRFAG